MTPGIGDLRHRLDSPVVDQFDVSRIDSVFHIPFPALRLCVFLLRLCEKLTLKRTRLNVLFLAKTQREDAKSQEEQLDRE